MEWIGPGVSCQAPPHLPREPQQGTGGGRESPPQVPLQAGPSKGHPSVSRSRSPPPPSRMGPSSAGGWERWALECLLTAPLLLLFPLLLTAHFLHQEKSDCHFFGAAGRSGCTTCTGTSTTGRRLSTSTAMSGAREVSLWLKNGRPEKGGVAFGEELQNGDWTYQLQVLLETQPQRGDVYACKVGHASLEAPVTVQWEPRSSNAAKSKLYGAVGAVLGVVFLAVGLSLYLKNKKATPVQQPAPQLNWDPLRASEMRWGGIPGPSQPFPP
ncbi:LOW QUALITY PROTEIN: uncharacterized protein PHA67_024418 [Liasis olivaceus]